MIPPCLLLFSSAFLAGLSFPNTFDPTGFSFLSWICLIPLFYLLEKFTLRDRILAGGFFGIFTAALTFHWLIGWNIFGFLSVVIIFTVQIILFAMAYGTKPLSSIGQIFYVSALWVAVEFLRSKLTGGLSWGLGHSQAFHPWLIQLADATGSYGISFVIVWVNYCFLKMLIHPSKRLFFAGSIVVVALVVLSYGWLRLSSQERMEPRGSLLACSLQPNISMKDKNDPALIMPLVDRQMALTKACFQENIPDLIIWPETAVTDDVISQPEIHSKIADFVRSSGTNLLTGSALLINDRNFNSAVLFNKDGGVSGSYRKIYLVPFSEYAPIWWGRKHFFKKPYEFQRGDRPGVLNFPLPRNQPDTFGVVICSEDGYPKLFRRLIQEKAGFVVVMLNDGAFSQGQALMMHAQSSVMRAVEFRTPIIRSANTGLSGYINPWGEMPDHERLALNTPGVINIKIYKKPTTTFYGEFGDIFSVICVFFVMAQRSSLLFGKNRKRGNASKGS